MLFSLNLFIYLWLCWVFVAVHGLSLVAASESYSLLRCVGVSLWWLLLFEAWALGVWASVVVARGLQSAGSVVVAHQLSCSVACGVFPDQNLNPCPLHWQADSFKKKNCLFIWLHWVFVAERRLPLVASSRGYCSMRCEDFSSCGMQAQ